MAIADVHIRKNETGEVRVYKHELDLEEDGSFDTYLWEEGNYSCDCNRALFFARVNGEEEDWELPCSDIEYSVEIFLGEELIYSEKEKD